MIPSTSGTDILNAIHIVFPPTVTRQDPDSTNTAIASYISINDANSIEESQWETTSDYSVDCSVYLCYLIRFTSDQLSANRELTITITNLVNPESILTAGDITISTMMQYDGDSLFYKIDTVTTASGFRATRGTIDSASMSVTSIYGDFSTYADN